MYLESYVEEFGLVEIKKKIKKIGTWITGCKARRDGGRHRKENPQFKDILQLGEKNITLNELRMSEE